MTEAERQRRLAILYADGERRGIDVEKMSRLYDMRELLQQGLRPTLYETIEGALRTMFAMPWAWIGFLMFLMAFVYFGG